jgi:hypothetical protein
MDIEIRKKHNKAKNITVIVSIAFLLIAMFEGLPYGYFQLIRLIVCGTTIYLAWLAYSISNHKWIWLFGFILLIFNPLIPLHFGRELWRIIDVVIAVFLITSIFYFNLLDKSKGD